jgi:hypothetical protein
MQCRWVREIALVLFPRVRCATLGFDVLPFQGKMGLQNTLNAWDNIAQGRVSRTLGEQDTTSFPSFL